MATAIAARAMRMPMAARTIWIQGLPRFFTGGAYGRSGVVVTAMAEGHQNARVVPCALVVGSAQVLGLAVERLRPFSPGLRALDPACVPDTGSRTYPRLRRCSRFASGLADLAPTWSDL